MRLITVSIITLIISALLFSACRSSGSKNHSTLLDSAQVTFLGDDEHSDYLGNATGWNDRLILIGTKKELNNGKDSPRNDFVEMVNTDAEVVWEKRTDELRPVDVAPIDSESVYVLLNQVKGSLTSEFLLWKMSKSGAVVQEIKQPLPENTYAKYIERVSPNQFIVLTWKKSETDTTVYVVDNSHFDALGNRLPIHWDLSATKLFPLHNGDFLGITDNTDRKEPCTTRIMRIRSDGTMLWSAEKVTDPLNSAIYGVAETDNGDLILSAFSERAFVPILAKYSASGDRMWVKSPPELQGCRIYGLTSWKNNQYIIAAQKTLSKGSLSSTMWDALAAIVIDRNGTIIDYDVIPQYWTITVGGVLPIGANQIFFLGIGGKDPREFLKNTHVALYKMTR